ncbi:MAG: hypothetical protein NTX82_07790 [Candidatus Parcubacteria bacterium]|nr:hypothetical protein [Candidatus Parcubacteria bacterium]
MDPTEDNNLRNSNPNWDPAYYEVDGIKYYYIETTSDDFGLGELPTELIGQTAYVYKID